MADWLLARGQHWVATDEVAGLLGIPRHHVSPTLARWQHRGHLFSPTTGAYVPIPPEYRAWGAVPASHFIDQLMRHLHHPYYVALLSAAEALGVAHQRPQVFQVMTTSRLRDRAFGRVRIAFITSNHVPTRSTLAKNTPTGTMQVSTPAVTALDLVSMPHHGGGLSNVATVLADMLEESLLDIDTLSEVACHYPAAVAQRAGWLLEHAATVGDIEVDLRPLERTARLRDTPTPLLASGGRAGSVNHRWHVIVNTEVEPDL